MESTSQTLTWSMPKSNQAGWASSLIFESDPPYYLYVHGSHQAALQSLSVMWKAESQCEDSSFRVVARQGLPVGVISYYLPFTSRETVVALQGIPAQRQHIADQMFPPLPASALFLRTLAIDSHFRGAGIGSLLMAELCEMATQGGATEIAVDVDSGNPNAVRFYEQCGFEIKIETVVRELLAQQLPASYRMIKPLDL